MEKKKNYKEEITELIKEVFRAIIIVALIYNFIAIHAKIPSGSMIPTIQIKDHVIVNRVPYYFKDPVRGEIIVFNFEGTKLIKRVIGQPGETVDIRVGQVYINGELLNEDGYLLEGTWTSKSSNVEFPLTLGEDEYLVMGDNRDNSYDGRFFGPIKRDVIIGKGSLRVYPFNKIGFLK